MSWPNFSRSETKKFQKIYKKTQRPNPIGKGRCIKYDLKKSFPRRRSRFSYFPRPPLFLISLKKTRGLFTRWYWLCMDSSWPSVGVSGWQLTGLANRSGAGWLDYALAIKTHACFYQLLFLTFEYDLTHCNNWLYIRAYGF